MTDGSRQRLHYSWIIASVTLLILLASACFRSAPGVFIVPLENELGWDRATISSAISVNLLLYGLLGPFAAALMIYLDLQPAPLQFETAPQLLTSGCLIERW